ncbi:MAG: hypothetical protein QNJ88_16700 [Acidimicrobiia bacterium]|nr:hypothetical protein [Acidimicrobiia bacterium]
MRALVDIVSSALGAQMALAALVIYEAWPRFIDGILSFDNAEAQTNAQFWSTVIVIGIGVGLVWRWHRRELAIQIGVTTTILLLAFSYLQAWISLDRGVGFDEWGTVIADEWLWFWVLAAPFAAGAWWVRQIMGGRSR